MLLNFGIRVIDDQVKNGNSGLHHLTNIVGTGGSGSFLYLIAILNIVILVSIIKVFFGHAPGCLRRRGARTQLNQRGLMNRFFGPLARRIDTPWKMYPIGVLFGLGFDTATEVALLVLSGTAVAAGSRSTPSCPSPFLFAAGMSLFDTIDGCFMNFAYGWAFSRPIRKVYYNITITGLSVASPSSSGRSSCSGCCQRAQPPGIGVELDGQSFNINSAGFIIVGIFVVMWAVALLVWRFGRIESRWEAAAEHSRARRDIEVALTTGLDQLENLDQLQPEPV